MMPVPSHLIHCVIPKESESDESRLDAVVRCVCSSMKFELLYPGQITDFKDEDPVPRVAEIDGKFFLVIKALCAACRREHLLLDSDFHGWNGFICHDVKQAALPRPSLVPWKCTSCGAAVHEASVQICTEGKADFILEAGNGFNAERWPDAFSWFSMAIKCVGCGKYTPDWISYETM
jgi:hypothetical protein